MYTTRTNLLNIVRGEEQFSADVKFGTLKSCHFNKICVLKLIS